jgi:hypothetical protein
MAKARGFTGRVDKRPYAYRLIDHGEIHGALNLAQSLLTFLIEDAEKEVTQ